MTVAGERIPPSIPTTHSSSLPHPDAPHLPIPISRGVGQVRGVSRSRSFILLALAAGLAVGAALQGADPALAERVSEWVAPLGSLWINALLMLVLPLVLASLVSGIAGAADLGVVGRLGRRALAWFLALATAVSLAAAVAVPPVMARLRVDPAAAAALRASAGAPASTAEVPTAAQWLANLLPSNPVRAAAEGKLLPLVLFTVLFALALTRLPRARAAPVVDLATAIVDALRVLVEWVLLAAPVGVFALALPLAARFGAGAAGLLGAYLVIAAAMHVALALAMYPFARVAGGVPVARFARAAAPAQAVAFVSRSSIAALPSLMDGARRVLGAPDAVASFVLPLAVSVFKCGAPVTFLTGAYFLSAVYGVPIAAAQLPFLLVQVVLLSFTVPGIPGGSVVIMAPLLAGIGVPAEGLGLLLAVDVLGDMFRTLANVTADQAVAAVLVRGEIPPS